MKKRSYLLVTAVVLFAFLLPAGCGRTAALVSRALPNNDWPRKRIMLMPAIDLTTVRSDELLETVHADLSRILRKTGSFSVYHWQKNKNSQPVLPGGLFVPELMKEAEEIGLNAIIFETLNPVETNPDKTGIWPFRRRAWRFTVSMNIDILDVNRGTMLLSKEVADTITLSDKEVREKTEGSPDVEAKKRAIKESLPVIIEEAAAVTILSLNGNLWTSTIVSVDTNGILINVGSDVGLRPGTVFEVFGKGESITSCKGQTYHLPGPKVGEIKTTRIDPRQSWAKPITGTAFKSDQLIRVKK
jgi:hypothetical protein